MIPIVAIILLIFAIFVIASLDKEKRISKIRLFKIVTFFSFLISITTLILWIISLFCFEMRLDCFPAGDADYDYCEVAFFLGTIDITLTKNYGPPTIIERVQQDDPHKSNYGRSYSPPKGIEFSARWIGVPNNYPRLLSWFSVEQDDWPGEYSCKSIEIPEWFIVVFFAIVPVVQFIRYKLNGYDKAS